MNNHLLSEFVFGIKTDPTWKYIWNLHMLKCVKDLLYPDWLLYIIHGFIGQSSILYIVHWKSIVSIPAPLNETRQSVGPLVGTGTTPYEFVVRDLNMDRLVSRSQARRGTSAFIGLHIFHGLRPCQDL